jgi:hypothetical protein
MPAQRFGSRGPRHRETMRRYSEIPEQEPFAHLAPFKSDFANGDERVCDNRNARTRPRQPSPHTRCGAAPGRRANRGHSPAKVSPAADRLRRLGKSPQAGWPTATAARFSTPRRSPFRQPEQLGGLVDGRATPSGASTRRATVAAASCWRTHLGLNRQLDIGAIGVEGCRPASRHSPSGIQGTVEGSLEEEQYGKTFAKSPVRRGKPCSQRTRHDGQPLRWLPRKDACV